MESNKTIGLVMQPMPTLEWVLPRCSHRSILSCSTMCERLMRRVEENLAAELVRLIFMCECL